MLQTIAAVALVWYTFILLVSLIGCIQIYRHYSAPTSKPVSTELPITAVPHVTIIRPISGLEPHLYECLASTFHQSYPSTCLTVYFCISAHSDPSYPVLKQLQADYPSFDSQILIEDEDPNLLSAAGREQSLGPNPKIRNMSRAYREARGDIIWIVDCNVWVSRSAAGLMVDLLCGFAPKSKGRRYKFVHQLPLATDISTMSVPSTSTNSLSSLSSFHSSPGSILDELFLSTCHAKMYSAISAVAIAPCTVGKSNMFRRSHLDALTQPSMKNSHRNSGIDFFSDNICEDHLIGDLLWKTRVPSQVTEIAALEGSSPASETSENDDHPAHAQGWRGSSWGNHALLFSPPCVQPLGSTSLSTYVARRARWLRVRKFTVPVATLVEPGVESLVDVAYGAFGLTTLKWSHETLGIPQTWGAFFVLWTLGMLWWAMVDWWLWSMLQGWSGESGQKLGSASGSALSKRSQVDNPSFVGYGRSKPLLSWILGWLGRELLAFPVWAWAVIGGSTVVWKGKVFKVGMDMRVYEVVDGQKKAQ